jgi:plasmid stabilization system protein ParE
VTQELRVHPEARREFNDAIDYYERESPGLGLIFANEVDTGFARIRQYPDAAPLVAKRVRRLVLAKFPLSLIYETDALRARLTRYDVRRNPEAQRDM